VSPLRSPFEPPAKRTSRIHDVPASASPVVAGSSHGQRFGRQGRLPVRSILRGPYGVGDSSGSDDNESGDGYVGGDRVANALPAGPDYPRRPSTRQYSSPPASSHGHASPSPILSESTVRGSPGTPSRSSGRDMDQAGGSGSNPVGQAAVGDRFRATFSGLDTANSGLESDARERVKRATGNGAGARGTASGSVGDAAPIPLRRSHATTSPARWTMTNKFLMKTWAYAFGTFGDRKPFVYSKAVEGDATVTNQSFIRTTSLAYLPVMNLAFYLTPIEYASLPIPTKVTRVGVRVIPVGNQVSFDYGASLTGSATSEHVVLYCRSIGLDNHLPVYPYWYTANTTDPMKVASATRIHKYSESNTNNTWDHVFQKMWGKSSAFDGEFAGVDLAVRHFNTYVGYTMPYNSAGYGHWRLDKYVDVFPADAQVGSPIIEWDYTPIDGTIAFEPAKRYLTQDYPRVVGLPKRYLRREKVYVFAHGRTVTADDDSSLDTQTITYKNVAIENGDIIVRSMSNLGQGAFNKVPNLPFFGVMPVQANCGGDACESFIRCSTLWQLETSIDLEWHPNNLDNTLCDFAHWGQYLGYRNVTFTGADRFYGPRYYGLGLNSDTGCQPHKGKFDTSDLYEVYDDAKTYQTSVATNYL